MSDFRPRPKQSEILTYRSGWMGIAAVPGAGKTRTLSELAAQLLNENTLELGQELLIVTLSTSAVGSFAYQMRRILSDSAQLSSYRYRVRTLHGLAKDIVSERPDLVGMSDGFTVIDERESDNILNQAIDAWQKSNPGKLNIYVQATHQDDRKTQAYRLPRLLKDTASAFIKRAKDNQIMPDELGAMLSERPDIHHLLLANACNDIYTRYQQGLSYRGGVDFQDLIRLALKAINQDEAYKARLSHRWPYILEDEAQDSSQLQENILRELAGEDGNWVRVGDPNQAIYETFTTANPEFLHRFLDLPHVIARDLPNSGRSQPSIIKLANHLIDWSATRHPSEGVRRKHPLRPPHIEPTPEGDPQPNPPDEPRHILLDPTGYDSGGEIQALITRLREILADDPDQTIAVLSPSNHRGYSILDVLKTTDIPYLELLQSSTNTREVAGTLYRVLKFLADPLKPKLLAAAYQVYRRDAKYSAARTQYVLGVMAMLKSCSSVETFLSPSDSGENDWLASNTEDDPDLRDELANFRDWLNAMVGAAGLPIDQLILTAAQTLFSDPVDLATAYSIAGQLRRDATANEQNRVLGEQTNTWGLDDFAHRLLEIIKNERKFLGMASEEQQFTPEQHRGKVVITTIHKAKGLEWDTVFITSANSYDFPAALNSDKYIGEKFFIKSSLNLQEEGLAQLVALVDNTDYREGDATEAARIEYSAERLRLLYVGITRARRRLIITWNTGRLKKYPTSESLALRALRQFYEGKATS